MTDMKKRTQLKLTRITNLYNRGKITIEEFAKRRDAILFDANKERVGK
jgi:hypothetical protein